MYLSYSLYEREKEKKNKILQHKDKSDWNSDMVKGSHRDWKS